MSRNTLKVAVCLVAVLMLGGGLAAAAVPAPNATITGCYHKQTGALRVVDSVAQCRSQELGLTWNQQGPQGPPGAPGPAGPVGPAGPAGISTATFEGTGGSPVGLGGDYTLVLSKALTEGSWVAIASATIDYPLVLDNGDNGHNAACQLRDGTTGGVLGFAEDARTSTESQPLATAGLTLNGGMFVAPGESFRLIQLWCYSPGAAAEAQMVALQVGGFS